MELLLRHNMNYDMEKFWQDSHASVGHSSYLENLYELYLDNPASIPLEWKSFFDDLQDQNKGQKDVSHQY